MLGAWREVLHISEWSGLSVGALVGLGFLVYLVPLARQFAAIAAAFIAVGYGALIYGDHTGRADLQAQWNAEKAQLEQKAKQADRSAAADDTARASAIEAKAKEQHAKDVAEIEQLRAAPACVFGDADLEPGGLRVPAAPAAGSTHPAASGPKAADKSPRGPNSQPNLFLSLVRRLGLQGHGSAGNASPHGQ
ncbi:hypothetical protein [Bradyrhizobium sp.]|uniref:hypothetical protein n=1 Tax=Bradyrhizobium sp. TaxID=376 RepID=UPI003C704470